MSGKNWWLGVVICLFLVGNTVFTHAQTQVKKIHWIGISDSERAPEWGYQKRDGSWWISVQFDVPGPIINPEDHVVFKDPSGAFLEPNESDLILNLGSVRGSWKLQVEAPAFIKGKSIDQVQLAKSLFSAPQKKSISLNEDFPNQSVLANGTWYKLRIPARGVYRLTYAFLKAQGIDLSGPVSSMGVFGNGLGMLPFQNSVERPLGLVELATYQKGLEDGQFNSGDYLVFVDPGQRTGKYNSGSTFYEPNNGLFDADNYVFFTTDQGSLKEVETASDQGLETSEVDYFDDYQFYGQDLENLTESGRRFYGEVFDFTTDQLFSFNYSELVPGEELRMLVQFASRTLGATNSSTMELYLNNEKVGETAVAGFSPDAYLEGRRAQLTASWLPPAADGVLATRLNFIKDAPSSRAWLDNIILNYKKRLRYKGLNVFFRNEAVVANGAIIKYKIQNPVTSLLVWDVSNFVNPLNHPLNIIGQDGYFTASADTLKEFVMFNPGVAEVPEFVGKVENQNLHASLVPDYLIVAPAQFSEQAEALAEIHREEGLDVLVVDPQLMYNEFSSGSVDITGIKDFARMLYVRGNKQKLKYLLLFGDGSYKNLSTAQGNTNILPTYQSAASENRLDSYVSDDYYGLLDADEGDGAGDLLDLGIGRFPVNTASEANNVIAKIKAYMGKTDVEQSVYGNWRTRIMFVADDFDGDSGPSEEEHTTQADFLANFVSDSLKDFLVSKNYMELFPQITTPGGERYPEGQRKIKEGVANGALIVNYTGHGGEVGWAHERILDIPTILNWNNLPKCPLFVTATCEFTRFDDPDRISAGEWAFLSKKGAGIALLTTTRVVFSAPNFLLNKNFFYNAFDKDENGDYPRLGDIVPPTKNASISGSFTNHRNFSLIGDPAMRLNYPENKVQLTHFNGEAVGQVVDTLKALGRVTLQGEVLNEFGQRNTGFNGELEMVVVDREDSLLTLSNDGGIVIPIKSRNSNIFKGRFSVNAGHFEASFIAPKDVSFFYDTGLISLYAFDEENKTDASGVYENFVVGGTSTDALNDAIGPVMEVFLNDRKFINGGVTSENPILVVDITDDFGINTTGNGLGHDLTAVLDGNTNQTIVLNEYFQGKLDSSASGTIEYRLENVGPGEHEIAVKAWDVNNNSSVKNIRFVVEEKKDVTLAHVLNYPNPFTTQTGFYFEHNQAETELEVEIEIYSVNGRLVRVLKETVIPDGFRFGPISWNGRDEFNQPLGKGVYMYQLKVTNAIGASSTKMEKLVILQ